MLVKNIAEKTSKNGRNNWERSHKLIFNLALFLKDNVILDLIFITHKHFLNSVSVVSLKRSYVKNFIGSYELLPQFDGH